MANSSGKFTLGLLLGAVAGAAAAYFSDKDKRERFSEDFSEGVERAKDTLLDNYEEAKVRYEKARKRLMKETEELIDDANELDELREEITEEVEELQDESNTY